MNSTLCWVWALAKREDFCIFYMEFCCYFHCFCMLENSRNIITTLLFVVVFVIETNDLNSEIGLRKDL